MSDEALLYVLCIAFLAFPVWIGGAAVWHRFFPTWIGTGFYEPGSAMAARYRRRRDVAMQTDHIVALGFTELGVRWELDWPLDFPCRDVALESKETPGLYASVGGWIGPAKTYFISRLADGGMLMTVANPVFRPAHGESGDLVYGTAGSPSPSALLEAHAVALRDLEARGRPALRSGGSAERLALCEAYFRLPTAKRMRLKADLTYLGQLAGAVVIVVMMLVA